MSKDRDILNLITKIKNCMRCPSPYEEYVARDFLFRDLYSESPWFFPPMRINGVEIKGFFGTGKMIFVAKRPSTGKFPDPRVRYFYELLRKHNFANAHLTDLIKCRGLAKKKEEINDQFENCKETVNVREESQRDFERAS